MYRTQKNLTINEEQRKFIEANDGKMSLSQLSKCLGLGWNKIQANRRLLGLVKPKESKVIDFSRGGRFDVDQFKKHYQV